MSEKKKVNVRTDYSYEAKRSLPQYAKSTVPRKTLYAIVRGPGLNAAQTILENEELKAFALKKRIKLKFLQAKTEEDLIQFIKDANVWAAGIILNLGSLEDRSENIIKAIRKILISTKEVRGEDSYVEALEKLL